MCWNHTQIYNNSTLVYCIVKCLYSITKKKKKKQQEIRVNHTS